MVWREGIFVGAAAGGRQCHRHARRRPARSRSIWAAGPRGQRRPATSCRPSFPDEAVAEVLGDRHGRLGRESAWRRLGAAAWRRRVFADHSRDRALSRSHRRSFRLEFPAIAPVAPAIPQAGSADDPADRNSICGRAGAGIRFTAATRRPGLLPLPQRPGPAGPLQRATRRSSRSLVRTSIRACPNSTNGR